MSINPYIPILHSYTSFVALQKKSKVTVKTDTKVNFEHTLDSGHISVLMHKISMLKSENINESTMIRNLQLTISILGS